MGTLLRGPSLLAVIFFGCGGLIAPGSDVARDAGPDTGPDTGPNTGPNTGADARTDAANDAGVDARALLDASDGSISVQDAGVPPDPFPTSKLTYIDLGAVLPDTDVTFVIPPNTLGFHVVASGNPADSLESFRAPNGALVHENATPIACDHRITDSTFGDVVMGQVPMSNRPETVPVQPGTWTVRFAGSAPMTARVAIQTTPDGLFHGGVLDLNVFIPTGLTLDQTTVAAPTASTSTPLQERIGAFYASVARLYALRRGHVAYYTIAAKYRDLSNENQLAAAFRETKAAANVQALNLIFSESNGQDWWGIAGGIPGAGISSGTSASAVALAAVDADVPDLAQYEGDVLAHEGGHFLGLSHLSEFDNFGNDPLEDTAECPGMTVDNYQNCPDADNVMAAAGAVHNVRSSPLQRTMIQASPTYRPFLADLPFGAMPIPPGIPGAASARAHGATSYAALFGKSAGAQLSRGERALLAYSCGVHRSRAPLSAAAKADLLGVAADVRVPKSLRDKAARLGRTR